VQSFLRPDFCSFASGFFMVGSAFLVIKESCIGSPLPARTEWAIKEWHYIRFDDSVFSQWFRCIQFAGTVSNDADSTHCHSPKCSRYVWCPYRKFRQGSLIHCEGRIYVTILHHCGWLTYNQNLITVEPKSIKIHFCLFATFFKLQHWSCGAGALLDQNLQCWCLTLRKQNSSCRHLGRK